MAALLVVSGAAALIPMPPILAIADDEVAIPPVPTPPIEEPPALPLESTPPSLAATFSLTDILERLNGSRWMVEVRPMFAEEGEDATSAQDLIAFQDQMMTSQLLERDGFKPGRFTVTLTEGDAPVWEALQSSPDVGIAIWRGELHGDQMRGTVSKQPLEGASQDYLFAGRGMVSSPSEPAETTPPLENPEDTSPQNETP